MTLLIGALCLTSCLSQKLNKESVKVVQNIQHSYEAVVYILNLDRNSAGTGFHIGNGYFITANHVVASEVANANKAILVAGKPAEILKLDEKLDLALLKVDKLNHLKHFKLSSTEPKVYDWVSSLGWHFGRDYAVSIGFVSNVTSYPDYIFSTSPINPGCSGGPLVDSNFNVVGVNLMILSVAGGWNGMSIHLRAKKVKEFIKEYEYDLQDRER